MKFLAQIKQTLLLPFCAKCISCSQKISWKLLKHQSCDLMQDLTNHQEGVSFAFQKQHNFSFQEIVSVGANMLP